MITRNFPRFGYPATDILGIVSSMQIMRNRFTEQRKLNEANPLWLRDQINIVVQDLANADLDVTRFKTKLTGAGLKKNEKAEKKYGKRLKDAEIVKSGAEKTLADLRRKLEKAENPPEVEEEPAPQEKPKEEEPWDLDRVEVISRPSTDRFVCQYNRRTYQVRLEPTPFSKDSRIVEVYDMRSGRSVSSYDRDDVLKVFQDDVANLRFKGEK